jgi:hypothetical protein
MEFHTNLARSVVRIVEAADCSLRDGGREVALHHGDVSLQLAAHGELAAHRDLAVGGEQPELALA